MDIYLNECPPMLKMFLTQWQILTTLCHGANYFVDQVQKKSLSKSLFFSVDVEPSCKTFMIPMVYMLENMLMPSVSNL